MAEVTGHDFQNWALGAIITLALRLPSSVVEQLTCNEQVIRSIRMGGSSITPTLVPEGVEDVAGPIPS